MRHRLALLLLIAEAAFAPAALTYSLAPGSPAGAAIDPATGVFSWKPAEDQGPGEYEIKVNVSDGQAMAQRTFKVKVREVNRPPDIAPIPDQEVNEEETLTVPIQAKDPDTMPAPFRPAAVVEPPDPGDGETFYAAAIEGSGGTGSEGNPFRLNDLMLNGEPGVAMSALGPGDDLLFEAGTYPFNCIGSYENGGLCPAVNGTADDPITLRPKPGAFVRLIKTGGESHILATRRANGMRSYVRYLGFEIVGDAIGVYGTGHEIGWNRTINDWRDTGNNYVGIRTDLSFDCWIHHNDISGQSGRFWHDGNSTGFEAYTNTRILFEWNRIQASCAGIFDKSTGIDSIFRNNYIDAFAYPFLGNLNGLQSNPSLYNNFMRGANYIQFYGYANPVLIRNNLILCRIMALGTGNPQTNISCYDNIILSPLSTITTFQLATTPWALTPITVSNWNLFASDLGGAPTLRAEFGRYVQPVPTNLTEYTGINALRTAGMEVESQVISGGRAALFSPGTFNLLPAFDAAGRFGGRPGPADIEDVIDPSTVGPDAIGHTTPAATALTLTGPSAWSNGQIKSAGFVLRPNGRWTGRATPDDGGAGGTFEPPYVDSADEASCKGFVYVRAGVGAVTISITNDAGLTNPAPHPFN